MSKNIKVYYFLISIVGGIFNTAMPMYYQSMSFSPSQIGLLIAIPSAAMLFQPIWGMVVDKYNKARELGLIGILLSSAVLLLMYFAQTFNQVIVLIALYSFIKAPVWSSIDNIIITYCLNNNINYGPLRVFASIAWGASLVLFLPINLLFGFKSYFILNFLISIYVAILIVRLPKSTHLDNNEKDLGENAQFIDGLKFLIKDRSFHYIIAYTFFFSTLFVTNLNYQALYFENLGKSQAFIAVAMFISIAPELVLLPFVERISSKYNPILMLMIVSGSYILKYIGFATITYIPVLLLLATLHGIAMSFYIPIFIKLVKKSVPNNISTTAITFNGFVTAITGITTSIVAGYLSGHFGITSVFILVAILQVFGFIVLIFFKKNTNIVRV